MQRNYKEQVRTQHRPLSLTADTAVVPFESPTPQMPDPSVTAEVLRPDSQSVPVTTRSGRIVKRPAYFDDFIV